MHRRNALQEKLGSLGELGPAVFVVNVKATRAARAREYIRGLRQDHPVFQKAAHVLTSSSLRQTVERIREKAPEDGPVRLIVSVGGDTTFNAAFTAAEGTNNVVVAMRAGNATNAAINLHTAGGRILKPDEVIDQGTLADIRGIEMRVDGRRRLAATIADVGTFSRGAEALNTWVREVPGYHNARVRDMLHERILLFGHSALQPSIPVDGTWPDGTSLGERTLGLTVANARQIGHHAVFPHISLTEPGGFAFELPGRKSIPRFARQIQDGTLPGQALGVDDRMSFSVGRAVNGSIDGQHFGIGAGQTVTYGISPQTVHVLCVDKIAPQAA